MSDELCHSKAHFSSVLISDLIFFCYFIFSNPLYLSYLIFFSPYLLKLISFLSPLFITALLLFLAFLTGIVHENFSTDLAHTPCVLESLRPEKDYQDEGFQGLDDLGMYEILFGTCLMIGVNEENPLEISEKKSEENLESDLSKKDSSFGKSKGFEAKKLEEEKDPGPVSELKKSCPGLEERRLENFLKILDQFERMSTSNVDEKKKIGTKIDKAIVLEGVRNNAATKISANVFNNGGKEHTPMVKAHSQRISSSTFNHSNVDEKEHNLKVESFRTWDHNNNFVSFGSMRKEKEWKRTLACKLFEERHNVDGGEGMDSLWEAYEMNSDKPSEKKKRNKKTSKIEFSEECHGNEEEDEDGVVDGQLCCLQAVKLSAGKMNLGMGRPNLVKISKAIKGFGWLHHVSKHRKKVLNNADR